MYFLVTDDKKGVDRASTVVARETNEGTMTWYHGVCSNYERIVLLVTILSPSRC